MEYRDLTIDRVQKAFSPAHEITDPQMFVGRQTEIKAGILGLLNPGGLLAVLGLRGVGKTSIAKQLKLIAEGDTTLPKHLDLLRFCPKRPFNYVVHYIHCDKFVKNVAHLVERILFEGQDNPSLFSLTKAGDRRLESFKRTVLAEGSAGLFGTKIGAKGEEESTYSSYISDDVIQQFRALLGTVQRDNSSRSGLLILIDEFDAIQDKTGFASIVKSCSSEYVKFGIIGIGSTISELMHDHESIGRQIDLIRVPAMPEDELVHILRRAEYRLQELITFSDDVKRQIARRAEGFPYFVHLLGKEALLLAFERQSPHVDERDLQELHGKITEGHLSSIYEEVYHSAIKDSPHRELLLKIFAEQTADDIHTAGVYELAKDLGITNPSQLMKELATVGEGPPPVLTKVRDRYYRFTDPVFKVYARIRQWKFD